MLLQTGRYKIANLLQAMLFIVTALFAAVIVMGPIALSALPYGAGTYGTCQYGSCGITLISGGTVSLDVLPAIDSVHTTQKDDVQVETNSSTGFTLTFTDSDTNNALVNGAEAIPASSGTQASPISLDLNTWGYRVDGLGGFGAGPTLAQTNEPTASYVFAGVPTSNETGHILATTTEAANPAVTTTVWYGVHADASVPSGTYTTTVTYTAVTNN